MRGLAQSRRMPVPQGIAHLGQSGRHIGLEILAHPAQPLRIVPAGDAQSDGVEQMPALLGIPPARRRNSVRPSRCPHQPVDGRQQFRGPNRLGQEIVHTRRQAALAVFASRTGRQGDDGEVSPRGPLPPPQLLNHLEAVQLRHVHVQEQQVEALFFHQGRQLAARCSQS